MSFLQSETFRVIAPGTYALLNPKPSRLGARLQPPQEHVHRGLLYYLCLACTAVLIGNTTFEFLYGKDFSIQGSGLSNIYLALLAAYASDKEAGRWSVDESLQQAKRRKGEWFIALWVLFALAIFILKGFFHQYTLPHDLERNTIQIILIFCGTQVSKHIRTARLKTTSMPPREEEDLADAILSALQASPGMTTGQVAGKTGISIRHTRHLLAELVTQGKLTRISQGPNDPNTRYQLNTA